MKCSFHCIVQSQILQTSDSFLAISNMFQFLFKHLLFFLVLHFFINIPELNAHGRFMRPPSRSSVWRIPEFASHDPPKNYNDNELVCGSLHQKNNPGEECGVCGDPLSGPKDNEPGGAFYRGIITAKYNSGQVIDVEVELTKSHKGFMEWRLCANLKAETTQACFNQYLLQKADGSGSKLAVDERTGWYKTKLKLPQGLTCERCVIQWNYRAGNNWGTCENGTSSLGCGPQETFRGCADVSIS